MASQSAVKAKKRVYNSRRWKLVRAAAITRAGGLCEIRLPGCTTIATQGDHIISLEDGGDPYSLANTQAACQPCNVAKENNRRLTRQASLEHAPSRQW